MAKDKKTYAFSDLTEANFPEVAELELHEDTPQSPWHDIQEVALTEMEQFGINYILDRMRDGRFAAMNEATIWSRVNYPILMLAETKRIKAWSEIPAEATFDHMILKGALDGVLGWTTAGLLETPYLVVAEAKRGVDSKDPRYQLYGELLATAWLNQKSERLAQVSTALDEEISEPLTRPNHGCYIIAENWTFAQAQVEGLDSAYPKLHITLSREYSSRFELELIAKVLNGLVVV